MHPFEKQESGLPAGVSPHLDIRLKPGWRFDGRRGALVAENGQSISLRGMLKEGIKFLPVAPTFVDADPKGLTEDECLLARSLQVAYPATEEPETIFARLKSLDGLELVTKPPEIGLP